MLTKAGRYESIKLDSKSYFLLYCLKMVQLNSGVTCQKTPGGHLTLTSLTFLVKQAQHSLYKTT